MARFANDHDKRVYGAAKAAQHVIGNTRRCQFEARVDFTGGGGAIITEAARGRVRVTYYRSLGSLKAAWMDAVHSHFDCCLSGGLRPDQSPRHRGLPVTGMGHGTRGSSASKQALSLMPTWCSGRSADVRGGVTTNG